MFPLAGLCSVFPVVSHKDQPWAVSGGWGIESTWPSQRQHSFFFGFRYYRDPGSFEQLLIRSRWRLASKSWGFVEGIWFGRLRVFSLLPQMSSCILIHAREGSGHWCWRSWSWSSGSLNGFQHCMALLVLVLVFLSQSPVEATCGSQLCEFLNVL